MLTANTHGKQEAVDAALGFSAHVIQRGMVEKEEYVRSLGPDNVVAIGNGANDTAMCEIAALGIAVIGSEGAAASLIAHADIVVADIRDAFALILNPARVRATLRK
jgi:soluble P-type ATPase